MTYLIIFITGIILPPILYLKKISEWIIYFFFFFFWEFGLLRIILYKEFNFKDDDLLYLEKLVIPLELYSVQFIVLFFQVIILNVVLILFIKKTFWKLNKIKIQHIRNNIWKINKLKLRLIYFLMLFFSAYIIRDSITQIIAGAVTGYDALTNFQGSGYYTHVFLNRISLMLLLLDLINNRKISLYLIFALSFYSLYFIALGQRNELFGFIIALVIYWSLDLSVKRIKYLALGGGIGLFILRTIEVFRSGKYSNLGFDTLRDSITTIFSPIYGAESVVPFYSHYASLFIEHNSSLLLYFGWFIQSFKLINLNLSPTYFIYKENFFPFEERGMAINLFGSLNILENWVIATIYLIAFFFFLRKYIDTLMVVISKYIPISFSLTIFIYAIPSIILLGRNGLEGLRPILYHNLGLYILVLYLLQLFVSQKKKIDQCE